MRSQTPRTDTIELTSSSSTTLKSKTQPVITIASVIRAIKKNDLPNFLKYLRAYPNLLNYRLIAQTQQTPLLLAIENHAHSITQHLLQAGAKQNLTDNKQHNALDYANFHVNSKLVAQLSWGQQFFEPLFSKLKQLIEKACQQSNPHVIAILKIIVTKLNKSDLSGLTTQELGWQFDLYFTAQALFKAVNNTHDDASLINNIRHFFSLREHVLRGDDHDYCYNDTLANQLCYAVAKLVFPEQPPLNILWHNALTVGRQTPWQNWKDMSNDLNEPLHSVFRSKNNEIQDYESTLIKVIATLRRGNNKLKDIWLCLDEKSIYTPLTAGMLNAIQQRCAGFEELVLHSKELERVHSRRTNENLDIYGHFTELRLGLFLGDTAPDPEKMKKLAGKDKTFKATEFEAGTSAYLAIAKFIEWWNSLGTIVEYDVKGKPIVTEGILQRKIRAISIFTNGSEITIGNILEKLWQHPGSTTAELARDNTYFCTRITRELLEEMLANERVKIKMNALSNQTDPRLDNSSLDSLEQKTLQELKSRPKRTFNFGSIFNELVPFLAVLTPEKLATFDYAILNGLDSEILAPNYTPEQLPHLGGEPHPFFIFIYQNPNLIPIHPKLTLFTAILLHDRDMPGDVFFAELDKYISQQKFVTVAMQLMEHAFRSTQTLVLPAWGIVLSYLPTLLFDKLLRTLAEKKIWLQVWALLNTRAAEPAMMDELLYEAMHTKEVAPLSHWRSRANQPSGQPYQEAVLRFWKKAIHHPELLNEKTARILTHNSFPQITELLLNAKTEAEWASIKIYIKSNPWRDFNENFTVKLFERALAYDIYLAAELIQMLNFVFADKVSAEQRPLIANLAKYCDTRMKEKTPYFWYSFWGWHQGMSDKIKITAAIKKILSFSSTPIQFTDKEEQALHNGRLGLIGWWNTPAGSAPTPRRPA